MGWPLSQDYNEAIQNPASRLTDEQLRHARPTLNRLGLPRPYSGNFADVYELTCPDGSRWAIKCFTRAVPDLQQRYTALSQYLAAAALPFTVEFTFLPQGIRVHGSCYPVLKMRWVEGLLLNEFIRDSLDKPASLESLWQIWLRLGQRLREARMAHGDLQHGNILLVAGRKQSSLSVKLIDYDGMWVPALANRPSGEVGHASYQHPQRLQHGGYGPDMDRFALLLIATALRAVIVGGRPLWQRYDNEDNLLFRAADLAAPRESALFAELAATSDPLLERLVGGLWQACHTSLEEVPLLEEVLDERRPVCVVPGAVHSITPAAGAGPVPVAQGPAPPRPTAAAAPEKFVETEVERRSNRARRRRPARVPRRRRVVPAGVWAIGGVGVVVIWAAVIVAWTVGRGQRSAVPASKAVSALTPLGAPRGASRTQAASTGSLLPVPTDDEVAAARKELHAMFQGSDTRKDIDAHDELLNVLNDRDKSYSPALRYAAGLCYCEEAARGGYYADIVLGVRGLANSFAINDLELQAGFAESMAPPLQDAGYMFFEVLRSADRAAAIDDYVLAERFVEAARRNLPPVLEAQRRIKQQWEPIWFGDMTQAVALAQQEVSRVKSEFERIRPALEALTANPTDAQASAVLGRFRCLIRDDWDEGLPLLAQCADPVLKSLAQRDLTEPGGALARKELADAWYDHARGAAGVDQDAFRRRAHYWYKQALRNLPPTAQAEASERMRTLEQQWPELADRWRHLNLVGSLREQDYIVLPSLQQITTRKCYRGGVDLTVVARTGTERDRIKLSAGNYGAVEFNYLQKPGRGLYVGPFIAGGPNNPREEADACRLQPHVWHTLRWRQTPTRMQVWANGKVIFEKSGNFDMTLPRPVAVRGPLGAQIHVQSLEVRPVREP